MRFVLLTLAAAALAGCGAGAAAHAPDAGLTWAPGTAGSDVAAVERAIGAARPEARRLVALVDELVDARVGGAGAGAAGVTERTGERFRVTLDLAPVASRHGDRGVARLVLHELAHVIDMALLTPEVAARLDAAIPRGWGCDAGHSGACANRAERFAETFAKWATGDIGVDVYLGYRVPPPAPLDAWGAPLAHVGR